MNSVFLFNNYNIFFKFLAAGFCPKNLAFARKIMVLPEFGGCRPPAPWLVLLWVYSPTHCVWRDREPSTRLHAEPVGASPSPSGSRKETIILIIRSCVRRYDQHPSYIRRLREQHPRFKTRPIVCGEGQSQQLLGVWFSLGLNRRTSHENLKQFYSK